MTDADVIVVGACPTGLMLAGELGLAGVQPSCWSAAPAAGTQKAGGLSGQILELLRYRGLLERFEAAGTAPSRLRDSRGAASTSTSRAWPILRRGHCRSRSRGSSACSPSAPASAAPRSAAGMRWSGCARTTQA